MAPHGSPITVGLGYASPDSETCDVKPITHATDTLEPLLTDLETLSE